MNRDGLISVVEALGGAQELACANAVRDGAAFEIKWGSSLPGIHFEKIYRRRARHSLKHGVDVQGLDTAIERFALANEVSGLATVSGKYREFHVFLQDASVAIACISVPQSERSERADDESTETQ